MEKISVIVPYYNSSIFLLRKCLFSLIAQTYKNIEIMVVIDGATKNIDNLKEYFSSKDKRIRFVNITHGGVSVARNYGITHTDGKYIVFVDSDDYVDEIFLSKLYQGIQKADISICGVAEQFFPTEKADIDTRIFFSLPAEYNYLQYTNFSVNKMYKREVIEKNHLSFPVGVGLGEDAMFLADYYDKIKQISISSLPLYHYVLNTTSATKKYQPEYWKWEKKVIYRQWELFQRYPLTERENSYCYAWLYHKYKGLFSYYCTWKDNELSKYIENIIQDELFNKLLSYSTARNEFWSKEMLKEIKIWKKKEKKRIIRMYRR